MSYIGHADIGADASVEAIRQCVVEIEQAQELHAKQTAFHIFTIAVLSFVLFGLLVLLISL